MGQIQAGRRTEIGEEGGRPGPQDEGGVVEGGGGVGGVVVPFEFGRSESKLAGHKNYSKLASPRLIIVSMNKSDNLEVPPCRPRVTLRSPLTSDRTTSPVSLSAHSSSAESSNYLRYLSHLAAESPCDGEDEYTVYWDVVTKCLLYLKREHLNDDYHDELMHALLKRHLSMERLDPTPTDDVGQQLLRSGYFLAAYALLLLRLRGSGTDLLEYFRVTFAKRRVSYGETELKYYLGPDCLYVQKLCEAGDRRGEGREKMAKDSPYVRTSTCDTAQSP